MVKCLIWFGGSIFLISIYRYDGLGLLDFLYQFFDVFDDSISSIKGLGAILEEIIMLN